MIIFGWRSRASVIGRGDFSCPHCAGDRSYSHKRMRRWFTLFFIPVVPLRVLGEFVECDTCRQAFKPIVLRTPTTASLQSDLTWALREAIVTLLRASRTPGAEAAAVAILSSFVGRAWTAEELAGEVDTLDTSQLQARLGYLAATLNEQGKERFLTACVQVASTGGLVDADARAAIEQIAGWLLMTPAHTRGIIEQTVEDARA